MSTTDSGSSSDTDTGSGFAELNLPSFLLEKLEQIGYEKPSPIQKATIPTLLSGQDLIGMAQTGTGKTAAFALPILARLEQKRSGIQALVLCPTRELAIQVAEAFQTYGSRFPGFRVLSIYGGQDMRRQLQALKSGVDVVVGTPGRLLDHLSRRSLDLSEIKTLVLDEADEMLRMGFIDDVEMILQKTPAERQVALFSATMPPPIRKVADKYLRDPKEVSIKSSTSTNADIEQYYWLVQGTNKLDALTRMLEVEDFDGMIVFVRTKNSTVELADKLNARGFSASALNGDMNQQLRSRTVEQLKNGKLDIVVATDVAARGLDVERISHVMNYDIPYDNEAYVHRIGRTGRAGRSGKAILFVAPREQRLLQSIERTTRKKITRMELPTRGELIQKRSQQFKATVAETLQSQELDFFRQMMTEMCEEYQCSMEDAAAAMAYLLQKDRPLDPPVKERKKKDDFRESNTQSDDRPSRRRRDERDSDDGADVKMESFQIAVGHQHGVSPREIVGAIANEGGIEGRYIGRIQIFDDFSTIDLPEGMPEDIYQTLQRTRVCNQPLNLERIKGKVPEKRGRAKGFGGKQKDGDNYRDKERGEKRNYRSSARVSGDMPPPKRKPRREAFIEPDRAPGEFTNAPKKSKAGNKIEKPKKRGSSKKRVNKDKGKRRTPKA